MGHTLTLDIPDEVYAPLLSRAKQVGTTPEEVVLAWLMSAAQHLADDPLLQLAGIFASNVTDVSGKHDEYLGQGFAEELRRSGSG
jgi:hypothetical protein